MKQMLTLAALFVSISAFAQGIILFQTYDSSHGVNAPVYLPGGTYGAGFLGTVNAQLFLVGAGGALTALTPATTFNTPAEYPGNPSAMKYIVRPASYVIVPGVEPGGSATVILRAWVGSGGYDAATVKNESAPLVVNNLGGTPAAGGNPLEPGYLTGLQAFELIPEPSALAFGLLGTAALLYRRRN
ncbi:MAG TPA: hypothetical protein VF773_11675 [Verrucomicrobiae bacterium]